VVDLLFRGLEMRSLYSYRVNLILASCYNDDDKVLTSNSFTVAAAAGLYERQN